MFTDNWQLNLVVVPMFSRYIFRFILVYQCVPYHVFFDDDGGNFTIFFGFIIFHVFTGGFEIATFYTRERTRQLCRANKGIIPVQQDNGVSDESSDEDEGLQEDPILPERHTSELSVGK